MANPAFLIGQRIISPDGPGEMIETIGDKVVVKLDGGGTRTFPSGEVEDGSSAG